MPKAIYSLEKGLDILFSFNFKDKSLSAQTISEHLDIPLRTTYRYLETLKKRGILARYGVTGNCELGFALFKLGHIVPSQMKLTEIVLPYIQRVCGDFGHTGSNESTG
jgi:DNA-binding IclR family transcriptional regulator